MIEYGPVHAVCLECGCVLHIPLFVGSSERLLAEAFHGRLWAGCEVCGGELEPMEIARCSECAALLAGRA